MADIMTPLLIVAVVGIAIFMLFQLSKKTGVQKQVLFLRPRDKRGERLDITRETDRSVLCEKSTPVHRFIKIGSGWNIKDKGRTSTVFLGLEGSAYTAMIKEEKELKLSTEEFLRTLWGNKIYENMPDKMRDAVEKDQYGVTIEPLKIDTEALGLEKLSSDDVNDESDAVVLSRLSNRGQAENLKTKLLQNLVWFGLGLGAYAILQNIFGAIT